MLGEAELPLQSQTNHHWTVHEVTVRGFLVEPNLHSSQTRPVSYFSPILKVVWAHDPSQPCMESTFDRLQYERLAYIHTEALLQTIYKTMLLLHSSYVLSYSKMQDDFGEDWTRMQLMFHDWGVKSETSFCWAVCFFSPQCHGTVTINSPFMWPEVAT